MTITHHADDASLLSFAAGSMPDALAVVIAAHCSVCPVCAREVRAMERIGSVLCAGLAPSKLERATPHRALRGLEADVISGFAADAPAVVASEVPAPLRHLIGDTLDDVPWQWLGMGIWHAL